MYLLHVTMKTKAPITDVFAQRRHDHHGGSDVLLAESCGYISGELGGPALVAISLSYLMMIAALVRDDAPRRHSSDEWVKTIMAIHA
jgi:hypothetical protein